VGLHTEYQWRRSEIVNTWQQSLLRLGVDYRLASNVMVTVGYGHIHTWPYGEQPVAKDFLEHRLWQQLVLAHGSNRFHFHHRYRLEQRFLENTQKPANGALPIEDFIYKNRVRYRFFTSFPLNKPNVQEGALFLAAYNEVFLGFGENVSKLNILDQNRLYFALGYQFNPQVNLQLGYLNHQLFKDDGIRRETNHTVQVGLTYNLDFRQALRPDS
jgi:hypothetical protein